MAAAFIAGAAVAATTEYVIITNMRIAAAKQLSKRQLG